jgi:hypothetical protein
MNNNNQNTNGFKIFALTVFTTMLVFSVLYYVYSDLNTEVDIESTPIATNEQQATENKSEAEKVFKELAQAKVVNNGAVLAAEDINNTLASGDTTGTTQPDTMTTTTTATTPESTTPEVPATGTTEVTLGLSIFFMGLAYGFYILYLNPRKLALRKFEDNLTNQL